MCGDPELDASLAGRLGGQERRLRLLLAHLAGRAVRRSVDLDDLLQEVWLRVVSRPGGVPPPAPEDPADRRLARYLDTVARHVVIDVARALRAARRDGRVERLDRSEWSWAGGPDRQVPARTAGPFTKAAGGEGAERLVRAFEELAPEHRRVLGLRQLEGLNAREAARRMGRSETAVHSLYRRALAAWEGRIEEIAGTGGESARAPRPGAS